MGRYERLGLDRGIVNGAEGEVDDLLGMAECKTAAAASVTGVGGCTDITFANGVRHSASVDATDETASAYHEKLAVPRGDRRKPDFGLDFRIGRRPESDRDATVGCGFRDGGDV